MAYYPFWALLIILSLLASVGGFLWASRHGQFKDQERARYLPLRGETIGGIGGTEHGLGKETIAMLTVLAVGVVGLLVTIAIVALKSAGNGQ